MSADRSTLGDASARRHFDASVQTFLDQTFEGVGQEEPDADKGQRIRDGLHLFQPAERPKRPLPVVLYVATPSIWDWSHADGMEALASRSQCAVLLLELPRHDTQAAGEHEIDGAVTWIVAHGPDHGIDPDRLFAAGDALGAMVLVSAMAAQGWGRTVRGLILLTPVLAPEYETLGYPLLDDLSPDMVRHPDDRAEAITWPVSLSRRAMSRIPRTLIVTAELDAFRDGGEAFARLLMAAERDVLATRHLGAITGFTWLPPLLNSMIAWNAHMTIAAFVRADI